MSAAEEAKENGGGDKKVEMKKSGTGLNMKLEMLEKLNVSDYASGMVYLFQFPRAETIPSISPFCLKLETWLRIAGIKYENRVSWTLRSKRGQMPFVEVNGEQVADSTVVPIKLSEIFNVDLEAHLSGREKADAVAYGQLISESFFWCYYNLRHGHMDEIFGEKVQGKGFPSWPRHMRFMQKAIVWKIKSDAKGRLQSHGIGRYTAEETVAMGKKYLKAFATFLGDKNFVAGEKATTVDAEAFGHLAQIYYPPVDTELKKYMVEECSVIVEYLGRIRQAYWPDWDEATTKVMANTEWMNNFKSDSSEEAK